MEPLPDDTPEFDVFISHASEDKADVARPLYDALSARGLNVWLDELQLTVGDSLRTEIDQALSRSRFGLVVLSPDFFSKQWPGKELDGLTALEIQRGKTILPVWHNVSYDDVLGYSPTLADKLAANTASGIDDVAEQIIAAVQKAGVVISKPPPAGDSVNKTAAPNVADSTDSVDEPVPVPPTPAKSGFFSRLNQLQGLFGLLAVIIGVAALYLATSNGNAPAPANAPAVVDPDEVESADSDQTDDPKVGSTDSVSGGKSQAETEEPESVASVTTAPSPVVVDASSAPEPTTRVSPPQQGALLNKKTTISTSTSPDDQSKLSNAKGALGSGTASQQSYEDIDDEDSIVISDWLDEWGRTNIKSYGAHPLFHFSDRFYSLMQPISWTPEDPSSDFESIKVPKGFVTDFASVPRIFWVAYSPAKSNGYPAIIYSYLYWTQNVSREEADMIFKTMLDELNLSGVSTTTFHRVVRTIGGTVWAKNAEAKSFGECRFLHKIPKNPYMQWENWRTRIGVFGEGNVCVDK